MTRSWSKVGNCSNGIPQPSPEQIKCDYNAPNCIYTYSDWEVCASNGLKKRTGTATNPPCSGSPEPLIESCIPLCDSNSFKYYFDPVVCQTNGIQTKKYYKINNCEGGEFIPSDQNISCNYELPECVYSISNWGECTAEGIKNRLVTLVNAPCNGETPDSIAPCSNICSILDYNYVLNPTECPEKRIQIKKYYKINTCEGGLSLPPDETVFCSNQPDKDSNKDLNYFDPKNQSCTGIICNAVCHLNQGICCNNNWNPNLNSCQYNFDKEIKIINASRDQNATNLIEEAIKFAENGEIIKANAYKNLATTKAKMSILKNKPELTEKYEQALLALENGEYEKTELIITEMNLPEINTENSLIEQYLLPGIIILVILAITILIFFRKKEPIEDNSNQINNYENQENY